MHAHIITGVSLLGSVKSRYLPQIFCSGQVRAKEKTVDFIESSFQYWGMFVNFDVNWIENNFDYIS